MFNNLKAKMNNFFIKLSKLLMFGIEALRNLPYNIKHPKETLKHIWHIGIRSIPVVGLTGFFTGMILGLQIGNALEYIMSGTAQFVGGALGIAIIRELGPVLTSLIVVSRVCSSVTAELGTMRVTEQIDALKTLSVDPIRFLVSSRLLAGIVAMPVLTFISSLISMFGGWLSAFGAHKVTSYTYWEWVQIPLKASYVWESMTKSVVIGATLMLIATYQGFNAQGGADGVGKATIRSVVSSSFMVILLDYFLGMLFIIFKF